MPLLMHSNRTLFQTFNHMLSRLGAIIFSMFILSHTSQPHVAAGIFFACAKNSLTPIWMPEWK